MVTSIDGCGLSGLQTCIAAVADRHYSGKGSLSWRVIIPHHVWPERQTAFHTAIADYSSLRGDSIYPGLFQCNPVQRLHPAGSEVCGSLEKESRHGSRSGSSKGQ